MVYHENLQYAGKTVNWVPGDDKENYKYNLHNNFNKLTELGWADSVIEYTFNSAGFRDNEFPDHIEYLALGCSHTFGTGLHKTQTWVSFLGSLLDTKIWNAGVAGCAMDTVFRILDNFIGVYSIDTIFLLCPPKYRYEVCVDNNTWEVRNIHSENVDLFSKMYFTNDLNSAYNFEKNLLSIECICNKHNINLKYLSADHDLVVDHSARDLMHSGPLAHEQMARMFLQQL